MKILLSTCCTSAFQKTAMQQEAVKMNYFLETCLNVKKKVRELLQICLGQKCINYLANVSLFRSTISLSKKCINYLAKFILLNKWFLFLYTINSLIITILANLDYHKNCINSNICKHVPSKWAMYKPYIFITKRI